MVSLKFWMKLRFQPCSDYSADQLRFSDTSTRFASLTFADLSWPNKLGLSLMAVYTMYCIVRSDIMGAKEVNEAGEEFFIRGFKVERLVTQENITPLLTLR